MHNLLTFAEHVRVPAAIAFYVLVRIDKRLQQLTTAITNLHRCIDARLPPRDA